MYQFNHDFFEELRAFNHAKLNTADIIDCPKLYLSTIEKDVHLSQKFIISIEMFVNLLRTKSQGRYDFESDFFAQAPSIISTISKNHTGRKQLFFSLSSSNFSPGDDAYLGASIGMCFDFYHDGKIDLKCVEDYQRFYTEVYENPKKFSKVFGKLGGYTEPCIDFEKPLTSAKFLKFRLSMFDDRLFLGRNIRAAEIIQMNNMHLLVDECIKTYDAIVGAGYFTLNGHSKGELK